MIYSVILQVAPKTKTFLMNGELKRTKNWIFLSRRNYKKMVSFALLNTKNKCRTKKSVLTWWFKPSILCRKLFFGGRKKGSVRSRRTWTEVYTRWPQNHFQTVILFIFPLIIIPAIFGCTKKQTDYFWFLNGTILCIFLHLCNHIRYQRIHIKFTLFWQTKISKSSVSWPM